MKLMISKSILKRHIGIVNDIKELNNTSNKTQLISCSDDNTIIIWNLEKFFCELIISLPLSNLLCKLNILPNKEILALTNENLIFIVD